MELSSNIFQQSYYDLIYDYAYNLREKGSLIVYLIGSYPNIGGNPDHEYPYFLRHLENIDVLVFLIDPCYGYNYPPQFINNISDIQKINNMEYKLRRITFKVCNFYVTNYTWQQMVDISHILKRFNSIAIIMDFTGSVSRNIEINNSNYLYITKPDCLAKMDDYLHNPIIETNHKITIYNPFIIQDLLNEFQIQKKVIEMNSNSSNVTSYRKINIIYREMYRRLDKINEIYIPIISYIGVPNDRLRFNCDIQPQYYKSSQYYQDSKSHLLYRMGNYFKYDLIIILDNWSKSDYEYLQDYLRNCIYNLHYQALLIKYNLNDVDSHIDEILWDDKAKLRTINNNLLKTFKK